MTTQFRFEEAGKTYKGALEEAPDSFDANFAFAYFNQELNRLDQAITTYMKCLELAGRSGDQADVADTLGNLGLVHEEKNQMDAARRAYDEALRIYRELATKNPETYLPYVATMLNNLGILDKRQNRTVEARQEFEDAVKLYSQFAEKDPETFLPYMAGALNNLANLNKDQDLMGCSMPVL